MALQAATFGCVQLPYMAATFDWQSQQSLVCQKTTVQYSANE